jgi:glycolate oxidase FAD binding subunit
MNLQTLQDQVKAANEQRQPLRLRGAGTKDFYAEELTGTVLDLKPYQGIVAYEPSDLVITARCGTSLSEIESTLEEHGQFLAFEPPNFGSDPTIGGVIATGLSGPRRPYAGAARDFVLGATLLDARGEVLKFGGQVMKNVAGFDVSRLLCGSLGILGIITEVSIKVIPKPRAEATLQFEMSAQQAVDAFNKWSGQPLPLSAAAWWEGTAILRLSGASSAVKAAQEKLGGQTLNDRAAVQCWNSLRHYQHPAFESDTLWRASVPDTTPVTGAPLIDWGGALRWYSGDKPTAPGGTVMCWQGQGNTPESQRFSELQPTVANLTRRLKNRFDPNGIFNPGRLIPGL